MKAGLLVVQGSSSLASALTECLHEQDLVQVVHHVGACKSASLGSSNGQATAEELSTIAAEPAMSGKTKLVVVCSDASSAEAETALLQKAVEAVAREGRKYIVLLSAAAPAQVCLGTQSP